MTTDQERWNQAQRNTGNVMRGTQPHAAAQAQKTTGKALEGTYSSKNQGNVEFGKRADAAKPFAGKQFDGGQPRNAGKSQAAHDAIYKGYVGDGLKNGSYKNLSSDKDIAASMLKNHGADRGMTASAIAKHSPALGKAPNNTHDRAAQGIVNSGAKRNAEAGEPRDPRQNIKPGHETNRGADPKPASPSPGGGSPSKATQPSMSQAQMAAYMNHHGKSR